MSDGQVLEALNKVMARLDAIETKLAMLDSVQRQAPVLVDAAATVAGKYFDDANARGVDLVAVGQKALVLAEKAATPDKLDVVDQLLDRPELLPLALKGADAMKTLADAGALDESTIAFAASATEALGATRATPVEPVGAFGALMKMNDADVQRAVGFSLAMAKRLGQILDDSTALAKK